MDIVSTLVGTVFDTMSTAVTWFIANPICLIPVGVGLVGSIGGLALGFMGKKRKRKG